MIKANLIALLMGASWWYSIGPDGTVIGWQCSDEKPPSSALGGGHIEAGPPPEEIIRDVGPPDVGGVKAWQWDDSSGRIGHRDQAKMREDRRAEKRARWRAALRRMVEAQELRQGHPEAYTLEEIEAMELEADRLEAEMEAAGRGDSPPSARPGRPIE